MLPPTYSLTRLSTYPLDSDLSNTMDIALSSLQTTRTKCIVEGEAKNPEIKSNKKVSCIYLSVAEGNYLYCPGGS